MYAYTYVYQATITILYNQISISRNLPLNKESVGFKQSLYNEERPRYETINEGMRIKHYKLVFLSKQVWLVLIFSPCTILELALDCTDGM